MNILNSVIKPLAEEKTHYFTNYLSISKLLNMRAYKMQITFHKLRASLPLPSSFLE